LISIVIVRDPEPTALSQLLQCVSAWCKGWKVKHG
jgi:hypothetical protein